MLTENEWNTINNMLLELYTIDELDVFTSKIMKMIRMLIPVSYTHLCVRNFSSNALPNLIYFLSISESSSSPITDAKLFASSTFEYAAKSWFESSGWSALVKMCIRDSY